ncbi:helix-turn-helix transcriptional regulator [Nocardia lijiangensis]|uniref:helix-turn-helix transcriptional regulator n=1 Tax=Nocardia lijiangensis TaxID=299618 RepID=UPI001C3F565E|nr:helix-turn-helix transcriptional regulator [Nocardia lijiangensis]
MTGTGGVRRWRGIAALSPGRLVIVGQIGTAALHAHHTVQVIVAAEDMVLADRAGERVVCRAAVVPPDVAHAVVRGASHGALVHLDPESAQGARWAALSRPRDSARGWVCAAAELQLDMLSEWLRGDQHAGEGSSAGQRVGEGRSAKLGGGQLSSPELGEGQLSPAELGEGQRSPDGPSAGEPPHGPLTDEAAAFASWVRSALASESEKEWLRVGTGETVRHPAVAEVLRLLPECLSAGPVRLAELARAVHLSESRLAHVFSAELGIPFRPYLRWLRVQRAAELIAAGQSLTDVAHGAGFADSAHLTRVCRSMFGAPPSEFGSLDWRGALHRPQATPPS